MIKEKNVFMCFLPCQVFLKKQVTEKCIEIEPILHMCSLKKDLN